MSNLEGNSQYPYTDGTGHSSQPINPQEAYHGGANNCNQLYPSLYVPNLTAYTLTSQTQNQQNLNGQSLMYQHAPSVDEPYFGTTSQGQTHSLPGNQPTPPQNLGNPDLARGAQTTAEYIFVNYTSDDSRQPRRKPKRFIACKSCRKGRRKCERPHDRPLVLYEWCVKHKKVCETDKTPGVSVSEYESSEMDA